jgi:hypothetical protein
VAGPLSARERGILLAACAVVTLGLALAPGRLGAPIRRVANYRADTRDPIYNAPVDGAAIRRAGALIPNSPDETYYLHTRPEPQLGHDLIGAGLLFLLPALAVPDARDARWILSYQAPTLVPRGVQARRTYRIGPRIFLVRVAGR